MPSEEEIKAQQELLSAYRRTLFELLKQRALITASFIPPAMASGIQDARDQIRRIKKSLRDWEVSIDDHPNDEESPSLQPEPLDRVQRELANTARSRHIGWYTATLILLASVTIVSLVLFFIARNSTQVISTTTTVASVRSTVEPSLAELPTSVPPTASLTTVPSTTAPPTTVPLPTVPQTTAPPTVTSFPPSATSVPPTLTPVPPTATSVPPTPAPVPFVIWRDVPASDLGNPPSGDVQALFHAIDAYAVKNGFRAGFPNFNFANGNYGTILLTSDIAVWRDVPASDLGNPPDTDIGARFHAVDAYAVKNGFRAGFPNFNFANGNYGTILLTSDIAVWRDVSASDLGNPPDSDIGARFRAVDAYAVKNGFRAGFPNFNFANGNYGTILLKAHP